MLEPLKLRPEQEEQPVVQEQERRLVVPEPKKQLRRTSSARFWGGHKAETLLNGGLDSRSLGQHSTLSLQSVLQKKQRIVLVGAVAACLPVAWFYQLQLGLLFEVLAAVKSGICISQKKESGICTENKKGGRT
jgi:hypothetical protein